MFSSLPCCAHHVFRASIVDRREAAARAFFVWRHTMSRRNNNQLPGNLPQLQNCVKRDPESYKDEFLMQLRHFEAIVEVTQTDPGACNRDFEDVVAFLAHVSHCYSQEMASFPAQLVSLLQKYATVLHPDVRLVSYTDR